MKKMICALFLAISLNASAQVLSESNPNTPKEGIAEAQFVFEEKDFASQQAAEKYRKFILSSLESKAKVTELALEVMSTFDSLQTRCDLGISVARLQESLAATRVANLAFIQSALSSQK